MLIIFGIQEAIIEVLKCQHSTIYISTNLVVIVNNDIIVKR